MQFMRLQLSFKVFIAIKREKQFKFILPSPALGSLIRRRRSEKGEKYITRCMTLESSQNKTNPFLTIESSEHSALRSFHVFRNFSHNYNFSIINS